MRARAFLLAFVLSGPAVAAPAPACTDPAHRGFDFWLGTWVVDGGPDGTQRVGESTITAIAGGCGIAEHWRNAAGTDGRSLNAWDANARRWRQFWVGGDGTVLQLEGDREGDTMLLQGTLPGPAGGTQRQRIRWTPQADGSVVQQWDTSDDDGATWSVAFRGVYRRVGD
jgi:hypothetical protein